MIFRKLKNSAAAGFLIELKEEVINDDIFTGAAALTFYLVLALFPAMIFLLGLLPYVPVENIDQLIIQAIHQVLPSESATMFHGVVQEVTSHQNKGILSFGILGTVWAASTGMYAIIRQMNRTYAVPEERSFIKARSIAIAMTLVFGLMVVGAFVLIIFGDFIRDYIAGHVGYESALNVLFQVLRWVIILTFMLLGFALIYYYGPNVKQRFRFITPGSLVGVSLLILASAGFRFYIDNFGNYAATYGSLGAVIIFMLWLYMSGTVILFGSEINAILRRRRIIN